MPKQILVKESNGKIGADRIVIDGPTVMALAAQGLSNRQICLTLGISTRTLKENMNRSEEFSNYMEEGKAKGLAQVTNALFKQALKGNMTAIITYLKHRDKERWGEKEEDTLNENKPVNVIFNLDKKKK